MHAELKEPKSAIIENGRRKIHSKFKDGSEMIEEFDVITDELLLRKVCQPSRLGGSGNWVVEVGNDPALARNAIRVGGEELMRESSSAPVLTRQDTPQAHQWRIRNLPYPEDNFSVVVEGNNIVVRTMNKKYFKKLDIPEMQRMGLPLEPSSLSWTHQHNTLVVTYKKCLAVQTMEMQEKKERANLKAVRVKDEGQPNCAQQ